MLLHNSLDGVQPESGALPDAFGGEERLEDVGLHVSRNSWPVVANFHDYAGIVTVGSHSKLAFAAHGVNRIVDQVGPDLVEFAAERIHEQRNTLVIAFHRDTVLELVVQDRERVFE